MSKGYEIRYELQTVSGNWITRQCIVWCNTEDEIRDTLVATLQPCVIVDNQIEDIDPTPNIQNIIILDSWETESILPYSSSSYESISPELTDTLNTIATHSELPSPCILPEE